MSAMVSNPPQQSNRSRKKKAKAETTSEPAAAPEVETGNGAVDNASEGVDGAYESPYIKELLKNIRNVKKKLNATQKVDSIIAENPGVSLDELLASRKINADQKTQAQKKPSLQASLAQFEDQLSQYKQFDEEYQKRIAVEKSTLEASHKDELEKLRAATNAEARAEAKKESKEHLLILSKFLRAAAAKRQGGDETSPENRAFEGALLLVYGGEVSAVTAMEKLISGSDELVPTVDATPSEYTFKQVKNLSSDYAPYAAEEAWAEDVAQAEPNPPATENEDIPAPIATDPTIAHATMTEMEAEGELPLSATSHHLDTPTVPEASNIDAGAANAAAENNWDAKVITEAGPDGWVEIPRDPAETDTGNAATPAGLTSTQSWAEDVPVEPVTSTVAPDVPAANGGDGFHEVHHSRGRGGRGEYRGGGRGRGRGGGGDRGGEGSYRGRGGYRGDRGGGEGGYRGRGRGGRGNRGRGEGS